MEPNQAETPLPTVLILSKNIGDALSMAKATYLKTYTPENEKLHDRLCQSISDIKLDAPFVSEEYAIDTNYYNCSVRIACFSYGSFISILDSEDLDDILKKHGISSVEGLIFVSDLKGKKKEGVDQYLKYNKDVVEKLNPEFMMCFANTEGAEQSEDLFDTFQFGENEIFIEVVNDDLDKVEPVKPDLSAPKSKFEDKYGVDRVVENIECHMWPNMARKDVQKNSGDRKPILEVVKNSIKANEERKENKKMEEVVEKVEKKEEKVETTKKEEKETEETSSSSKEEPKKEENSSSKPVETKEQKQDPNPFEFEDDDEKEMEDLAAVLETVRQFKNSSKNLSDDVRREKAAELIMKLVANCKDLQDGSEEEDEDDN